MTDINDLVYGDGNNPWVDHPEAPISERNFETWLTTDPLALAIVAGDAEAVLQLSEHLPDYVKQRIAGHMTQGPAALATDAELRNAARRLAIKQKKARNA